MSPCTQFSFLHSQSIVKIIIKVPLELKAFMGIWVHRKKSFVEEVQAAVK